MAGGRFTFSPDGSLVAVYGLCPAPVSPDVPAAPAETSPACREVLQRIVRNYAHDRQLLREVRMTFYALSCTGEHSAVSLWSHPGASGEPIDTLPCLMSASSSPTI